MPAVSRHAPIGNPDLERTFQTEADDRIPRNPHRSTADLAATGITDGDLLKGVRYHPQSAITQSLVMRSRSGTVRLVDAHHAFEKLTGISAVDYS